MPLIHRHVRWCCWTGLNCRPLPYQGSDLISNSRFHTCTYGRPHLAACHYRATIYWLSCDRPSVGGNTGKTPFHLKNSNSAPFFKKLEVHSWSFCRAAVSLSGKVVSRLVRFYLSAF